MLKLTRFVDGWTLYTDDKGNEYVTKDNQQFFLVEKPIVTTKYIQKGNILKPYITKE